LRFSLQPSVDALIMTMMATADVGMGFKKGGIKWWIPPEKMGPTAKS